MTSSEPCERRRRKALRRIRPCGEGAIVDGRRRTYERDVVGRDWVRVLFGVLREEPVTPVLTEVYRAYRAYRACFERCRSGPGLRKLSWAPAL